MINDLYGPIGNLLKEWTSRHTKSFQPRLCAEFNGLNNTVLFDAIWRVIAAWVTDVYIIFVSDSKNETGPAIVNSDDLHKLLVMHFSCGNTITLLDPTNGGGCTVDWEGYCETADDSEVLVITWGEYENIPQNLVSELNAGVVFRGN